MPKETLPENQKFAFFSKFSILSEVQHLYTWQITT